VEDADKMLLKLRQTYEEVKVETCSIEKAPDAVVVSLSGSLMDKVLPV